MSFLTSIFFIIIILLVLLKLYLIFETGWCRSQTCLVGKTALVTGANTGIGYETAIDFAKRGARVILACRDGHKGKDAVERIIKETKNPNVFYKHLDLASFKSVRQFAEEINKTEPKLDILVNNAGAWGLEGDSEDGLNPEMQVNYYGHFLLTNLLLDLLKKSSPSRIVNVSSFVARRGTRRDPLKIDDIDERCTNKSVQYARTKLCNILFTIELNSKLKDTKVTTYSANPGIVKTDFIRFLSPRVRVIANVVLSVFGKSPLEGAQTSIYCAVQKGIEELSGEHFTDCERVDKYKSINDESMPKMLWENTEKLLKMKQS